MRQMVLATLMLFAASILYAEDFTVKKDEVEADQPQKYKFTYTKVVKDVNNVNFTIVARTEEKTVAQLQSQRKIYENAIAQIDKEIAEAIKLP